jgi:hypothetical protein
VRGLDGEGSLFGDGRLRGGLGASDHGKKDERRKREESGGEEAGFHVMKGRMIGRADNRGITFSQRDGSGGEWNRE